MSLPPLSSFVGSAPGSTPQPSLGSFASGSDSTPATDITTPTGQSTPPPQPGGNAGLNVANSVGGGLGIQKFGQGLATAGRVASGSINQSGTEEAQMTQNNQLVINKLQQLRAQGVPQNDLKYQQLLNFLKSNQGTTAVSQAAIDPGTQLSNKEVLGSAANVGLTILGAGSLPGEGAATGALSKGLPVAETLASQGSTALELGKTAATALNVGAKVAEGGALGYGMDVANSANNNQQSIFKPGLGTAVGMGLPIVTQVGSAILKNTAALATGAGKTVIQRAIDNPDAVSAAIDKFATTPEAKQQLVDTAKASLNTYLQNRSQQFGEGLSKMVATEPISKQSVVDSFANAVGKFGGQVKNGSLVFGDTALNSAEQKTVQDVFNTVQSWKDVTPQGMDTLRQRIGNEMTNFKFASNGRDSVVLGAVKQDLTKLMSDKIPGYADMLKNYGTQTQTAKDLAAELSLKSSNAKPATQLGQVMKIFQKDPVVMENLTRTMGATEANKFLNDVSGAILSSWMPQQGLAGKIAEGTAAGAAAAGTLMHNPVAIPAAAAGAAISSPRLVGTAATTAGKVIQSGAGEAIKNAATIAASKANRK